MATDFHHIVVGLELGKLSDQAVVRAMSLARTFGARLSVVHGAGVVARGRGPRAAALAAQTERALEAARAAARGKLELTVEDPVYAETPLDEYLHVRAEPGDQALLAFAREQGADLVVLGAHRHRKLVDLGGTGRTVLAKSTSPVWIEPAEAHRFERLLVPVDLSPSSALVLEAARSLARRFVVPVRILHVFVPPILAYGPGTDALPGPTAAVDELRESEHQALKDLAVQHDFGALPVTLEFVDGDPAPAIVERAGPADLIVMGTHGHTGFSRALLGSCAHQVLRLGPGPMLVIPQREELYLDAQARR